MLKWSVIFVIQIAIKSSKFVVGFNIFHKKVDLMCWTIQKTFKVGLDWILIFVLDLDFLMSFVIKIVQNLSTCSKVNLYI
jgi:hypothetical protein